MPRMRPFPVCWTLTTSCARTGLSRLFCEKPRVNTEESATARVKRLSPKQREIARSYKLALKHSLEFFRCCGDFLLKVAKLILSNCSAVKVIFFQEQRVRVRN